MLKDSGYETEAKQALIAKSEDLVTYGGLTWWQRLTNYLLGVTVGYGYRSHRALLIMAYIVFMGAGIFHDGKRNHLMVKTNISWASGVSKSKYPKFKTFLYSMDTFLPIVNLGQKDYWAPNANSGFVAKFPLSLKFTWGSALRLYLILHIILG